MNFNPHKKWGVDFKSIFIFHLRLIKIGDGVIN
jgi:hypothetical protein